MHFSFDARFHSQALRQLQIHTHTTHTHTRRCKRARQTWPDIYQLFTCIQRY